MAQQGQVLRMSSNGADGRALWAYRYRTGDRGSRRVQRGGFTSEWTLARRSSGRSKGCGERTAPRTRRRQAAPATAPRGPNLSTPRAGWARRDTRTEPSGN